MLRRSHSTLSQMGVVSGRDLDYDLALGDDKLGATSLRAIIADLAGE